MSSQIDEERQEALDRARRAFTAVEEAEAELQAALESARLAGLSWTEISDGTGRTRSAIRWALRDRNDETAAKERAEREEQEERARVAAAMERQTRAPRGTDSVQMKVAAQMLGISRPGLYTWIHDGRIPLVTRGARRAVAVDPESGLIKVAPRGTYQNPSPSGS